MHPVLTEPEQTPHVDCAVVIVTYNSASYITGLLDSLLAAAAGLTLRIIVVDNASTDATVERVRDHSEVVCVEASANLGYAGGINIGRQHAGQFSTLAVLNPDLTLEPGAFREMFKALKYDPAVGIIVPTILDFEGHLDQSLRREPTLTNALGDALLGRHFKRRPARLSEIVRDEREYEYHHSVDWATGAVMLISAVCDGVVGPWDEEFFLYSEEVDYAVRARAAGFRIDYEPKARARHRKGGSGQSNTLVALKAVSRVRYFEKHGKPARLMRAIVLLHEFLRSAAPSHRAALRVILQRSTWEELISGLKAAAPPAGWDRYENSHRGATTSRLLSPPI
jgi:GT2 family glycosyltransferase